MFHASTPRSRLARGLAVLAVALAALTACGGDDDGDAVATAPAPTASPTTETGSAEPPAPTSAEAPAEAQTVTATEGEFYIELSQEELSAGSVTIEVTNEGSATHDLIVERDGSDVAGTDSIAPGSSATLTVDLEPGEYVFYCSIGNHRAMGMEITVTVS